MFERFTDGARQVLVRAQDEARLLEHNFIGTEHLLLGALHSRTSPAVSLLRDRGLRLDEARADVRSKIGQGGSGPANGSLPFTPRAQNVLDQSLREAQPLGHHHIGVGHLLLAIICDPGGVASRVLVDLGQDLDELRVAVAATLDDEVSADDDDDLSVEDAEGPQELRCVRCRLALGPDRLGVRILRPIKQAGGPTPVEVRIVYCLACGTALPHTVT